MDVDEKTREMNAIDARCRVLEDENARLAQELDEANGVIAKARKARDLIKHRRLIAYRMWVETDDDPVLHGRLDAYDEALRLLDKVDGL